MNKRQRLGQHYLTSNTIAKSIVNAAKITKKDTVLEIGPGKGILLPHLCNGAQRVISIEADRQLYGNLVKKFSNVSNLILKCGDGFKTNEKFSVFVSNLPYSKSKTAMEWLIQRKFSCAVIMIQKEFAEKLESTTGKNRKAISVLVTYATRMDKVINVSKNNFSPPPKVESIVIRLTSRRALSKELIQTVNRIFSYRRKNIQNIAKQFSVSIKSEKKLDELSGDEIIKLAKKIIKK